LAVRVQQPTLGDGTMSWLETPADVVAFSRKPGFQCWVNVGADPVELSANAKVLVSSGPLTGDGRLPSDTAVWLSA